MLIEADVELITFIRVILLPHLRVRGVNIIYGLNMGNGIVEFYQMPVENGPFDGNKESPSSGFLLDLNSLIAHGASAALALIELGIVNLITKVRCAVHEFNEAVHRLVASLVPTAVNGRQDGRIVVAAHEVIVTRDLYVTGNVVTCLFKDNADCERHRVVCADKRVRKLIHLFDNGRKLIFNNRIAPAAVKFLHRIKGKSVRRHDLFNNLLSLPAVFIIVRAADPEHILNVMDSYHVLHELSHAVGVIGPDAVDPVELEFKTYRRDFGLQDLFAQDLILAGVIERVSEKKHAVKGRKIRKIEDVGLARYVFLRNVIRGIVQKSKHVDIIRRRAPSDAFEREVEVVIVPAVCEYGYLLFHGILRADRSKYQIL